MRLPAGVANRCDQRFKLIKIARASRNAHRPAVGGKGARDGAADTVAGADDEADLLGCWLSQTHHPSTGVRVAKAMALNFPASLVQWGVHRALYAVSTRVLLRFKGALPCKV